MRFLIILLSFLWANTITDLIGEKAKTYSKLIQNIDKNASLEQILTTLKDNGLIDIFFSHPKIIHPTFIFKNNNPIFNTKTLYSTLQNLGYYYFFPSSIKKNKTYSITLEMKSTHHIDPLSFLREIKNFGCEVTHIKKEKDYIYTIECKNEKIDAYKLSEEIKSLINAKGEYWIDPNGFKKIIIKTSPLDHWYPYITLYDKHLNILNIITKSRPFKYILLYIPSECKYIKVRDNYTKENFKRGIFVKGIK